ncbi:MAG: hypothetical protein VSS52_000605 [Thiotrichaceae bacterium]|nr:hypothetical protein [Thiotrichaceae bacterium]
MIIIFHHIVKTAGTSLRFILKQNYQLWETYGANRDSLDWYSAFYQTLPKQDVCIASHSAHFLIPILIEHQHPFQAFCLLRNPLQRVVSLYQFVLSIADIDSGRGGQTGRMIRELGWRLPDIYTQLGTGNPRQSELHELFKHFFNGQIYTLLAPHTDVEQLAFNATELSNSQQQILDNILMRYYTVGVQEHYEASIQLLAQKFNWHTLPIVTENASTAPPLILPIEIQKLILKHNQLDAALHQKYI